jgi:hypothetical protein
MDVKRETHGFAWWPAVAALTLVGLALRIAAARGGMWTDEAWSVIFATEVRDPVGVFLRINHDNNHHLNSLWLQAVGMHASPLLARAPAIVAGTLTIPVAALLFGGRSGAGAIAAAALFAISPIMVIYGSEARGYALMILATLFMILFTTSAIESRADRSTRWLIALPAAVGTLSHLTMIAPIGILCLWVYLEKRSSTDVDRAMTDTVALMGPALATSAGTLLLMLVPAILSPTGLQTGGYNPYRFQTYAVGLSNMEVWTAGLMFPAPWLAVVALLGVGAAVLVQAPAAIGPRARLYGLLILAVPVVIFVERIGNAQFARFYLSSAIGLLLLGAEWTAQAASGDRTLRSFYGIACVLFVGTAVWHDRQFVEVGRGQPERAIRLMAAEAPRGAQVDVATYQLTAPIVVAAEQAHYPLALAKGCVPAEFMVVARATDSTPMVRRCGRLMRAIGWSEATDLTGDAWVLYRVEPSRNVAS